MRNALLTVWLLASCWMLSAQSPKDHHFSIFDGHIVWQMVYECQTDSSAIFDHLIGSGFFSDISKTSTGFSMNISPRIIDPRSAGLKRGDVASYVSLYAMRAHGKIQIKPDKYRVTVDLISFLDEQKTTPLETYALNKNAEFNRVFFSMNAAKAIDHELIFLFTLPETKFEDW